MKLQPEVVRLAESMQYKLDKNAHKGDVSSWPSWDAEGKRYWGRDCSLEFLLLKFQEEYAEFLTAIRKEPIENVRLEAADVANLAMMIVERMEMDVLSNR